MGEVRGKEMKRRNGGPMLREEKEAVALYIFNPWWKREKESLNKVRLDTATHQPLRVLS